MRREAPDFDTSTQGVRVWRTRRLFRSTKLRRFVLLFPRILITMANNGAGFVRYGNANHSGLACLISNGGPSKKRMFIGRRYTNTEWIDILSYHDMPVVIDKRGYGNFPVNAACVGVWVETAALRRDGLQKLYVGCFLHPHSDLTPIALKLTSSSKNSGCLWLLIQFPHEYRTERIEYHYLFFASDSANHA